MDAPFPEGMLADIERVLELAEPAGEILYESAFRTLMFPLQRKEELRAMLRLSRGAGAKRVMEIGADKGGGCYHWLKALEPDIFIGIEIRGVPYAEAFTKAFPATSSLWLEASSYAPETVEKVRDWLAGDELDVLFIDGDKARFLTDFLAYVPMLRAGGIVLMHDIRDASPATAYEKAKQYPRVTGWATIESTVEVFDALVRERAGTPPADSYEGWLRHWRGRSCGVGVLWC